MERGKSGERGERGGEREREGEERDREIEREMGGREGR